MVDFAKAIATAQRLILENGRTVRLLQFDGTSATPSQPWKGTTDPRATPNATLDLSAVFVSPGSASRLGLSSETSDLIKRSTQILIVAPGEAVDVRIYHEVVDGSENWRIQGVEILRPGAEIILAYIGVRR